MYQIQIKPSAKKDIKKLPSDVATRIAKKIDELSLVPRPAGCKKLHGTSDSLWRIRVGDYRILYGIDDAVYIIDIHYVGNRRDVYDL